MIALDTNVIVRFLVRDDEKQARVVYRRFKQAESDKEPLFVPLVVVLESIWVLQSAYEKSCDEMLDAIEDLLRMPIFEFEKSDVLQRVLVDGRSHEIDLADLLIAYSAQSSGCSGVITFDRKAATMPFYRLLN